MRRSLLLVAPLVAVGLYACTRTQSGESVTSSSSPLIGAWLIVETAVTDQTGTTVDDSPEAGLYVFTERHFTNMLVPGSARPPLSQTRADEERLRAYDNFIADGGTYEYAESTLTTRNIIAKIPNWMPPHAPDDNGLTYQWQLNGDELVLTLRGGWAPRAGEITYRLRRLE